MKQGEPWAGDNTRYRCIACGKRRARCYYAYRYDDLLECEHCGAAWLYVLERTWDR